MKCHYEVLGVSRDANADDLKKAYRKLALKWHPDKNMDNAEEAKENFQLVQQAYEVLTDPHERAWYDNHREAILKGGLGADYKDECLNVFPYFTSSCFKGYGDDPNGFYAVYEEVFNKLAAEESEHLKEDDLEAPSFGKSDSSYDEVVAPFYSYWMSFSTKKSYYWLDPYDTREAQNRKVGKLIEKENKKVRDKAKKERNEEIRNLVAFVRKRDKRVQAYSKLLEERAKENLKKSEEQRLKQINERKNELKNYKETDWSKFSNLETDLKHIEENLTKEFGDDKVEYDDDAEYDDDLSSFFCVACNKVFKTEKAFANHEKSKRHKDNVELLKQTMVQENAGLILSSDEERTLSAKESDVESSTGDQVKVKKVGKQKKAPKVILSSDEDTNDLETLSALQKPRRRTRRKVSSDDSDKEEIEQSSRRKKKGQTLPVPVEKVEENMSDLKIDDQNIDDNKKDAEKQLCAVCKANFPSKNKLFAHLKKTGHSVYLPNEKKEVPTESGKAKKSKKSKK